MAEYGMVGLGLLGASIAIPITTCGSCSEFKESLSLEQQVKYKQVTKKRFRNYIVGLLIGIVFAAIYYYFFCRNNLSYGNSCIIISILLGTQYLYYMLAPKSYIINELTNDDQRKKWLVVHKTMMFRYHLGFVLGVLGGASYMIYLRSRA
jgi:uncharacterized membrane protein